MVEIHEGWERKVKELENRMNQGWGQTSGKGGGKGEGWGAPLEAKDLVPVEFDGAMECRKEWKERLEMYVMVKNPEVMNRMRKFEAMEEEKYEDEDDEP